MAVFAVETVTEDAHTALKMQRLGWGSAFLSIPLAAGLATERLGLHIIQRTRWARGMTQIFRVDNPLFWPWPEVAAASLLSQRHAAFPVLACHALPS
ncbi:Cellulose synthase 1 [Pantoea agglomerans]|uniref:Cellulose synthase 1 n=1 Tax=Enterobacter agglomerans TaxID=549 RepID=A0A379AML4_ENTAG|nr:Cellulose synthase 1 [Pantoea agglomerans]